MNNYKFYVNGSIYISKVIDVVAENETEAEEKVWNILENEDTDTFNVDDVEFYDAELVEGDRGNL